MFINACWARVCILVVLTSGLAVSGMVSAQVVPAPDSTGALEEITVTARKVTENLQKAPASIDVVTANEIQSGGISVPGDLDKLLPSATLRVEGAVFQTFIRGVGSNLDFPYTSPAVAITYNGIIVPRYGTLGILFDLSSIQEIAGPQGTLYGGSAAGGAINMLTQQPSNDYSGNALLEGGNYAEAHAAVSQNVRLSDDLSSRTSFDYNRHSGYESNGLYATNRIEGRESLLYNPTDNLSALFFLSGYRDVGSQEDASTSNVRPLPPHPWYVPPVGSDGQPLTSSEARSNNQTYIAGANVDWHVGEGVITYIPGYVYIDDNYNIFIDAGGAPHGGILNVHDKENQFSQELRWNQRFGLWNLTAGLFWLQNKTDFHDGLDIAVLPAALGYYVRIPVLDFVHQTRSSYSAFAQATYSITDELRVTVGGRESEDRISAEGTGGAGAFDFHKRQQQPDWKVGLDYDLSASMLLYANVQTSYIPFGYNPDVGNPAQILPESKLLAYSVGFKSRFFDNRLEINDEVYYYDYKNFQAFAFTQSTGLSEVTTARRSLIYGNELTVRWNLATDTKFDAAIVAQRATYSEFRGPDFDYSGYQMADAPHINAIVGLQHELELGTGGSLLGRVSTQYNSGSWGVFVHEGTFQPSYTRTDLSLTYTPVTRKWNLQAYVNNVENTAVFGSLGAVGPGVPGAGSLAPPRIYGLRLSTSWN